MGVRWCLGVRRATLDTASPNAIRSSDEARAGRNHFSRATKPIHSIQNARIVGEKFVLQLIIERAMHLADFILLAPFVDLDDLDLHSVNFLQPSVMPRIRSAKSLFSRSDINDTICGEFARGTSNFSLLGTKNPAGDVHGERSLTSPAANRLPFAAEALCIRMDTLH
jgi:hypothetical protein